MSPKTYLYSIDDIIILENDEYLQEALEIPEDTLHLPKESIKELLLSNPQSVAKIFELIENPIKYDDEILEILKKNIFAESFHALGESFIANTNNIAVIDSFIETYIHEYNDISLASNYPNNQNIYFNTEKENQIPLLKILLKNPLYEKGFYDVLGLHITDDLSNMMFKDFKLLLQSLIIAKDEVVMRLHIPESSLSNELKNIHKF